MKPFTTIGLVLMAALAVPAMAQDYEDEPGQGVARLSLIDGNVTVRRGDTGEFIAGERNAPLVARDHVITEGNSRAEIQLDWANMLRMSADTEVRMGDLQDDNFLIQVDEGTVMFSVLQDSSTLVEISSPMISVRPTRKGSYRITVRPDGTTEVTVRSGEAEIFSARRTETLRAGRTLVAQGDPNDPNSITHTAIARDDWDRWNEDRDRDLERSDSYRYVSRDIYGAHDLAGHGRWVYDSPYGWVWAPTVAVSWAPYRAGRWVWVDYYGWTWLSHDPWGWAPYHYGTWYHASRHGWVWYPGPVGPRHYWRPALVSFFGWGSGVSKNVSFGFGNVGWVPLAPYEVYRPWYGRRPRSNVTVNNITVVNNVNIINNYRNARFVNGHNGVTSIASRDFGRKQVNVNNFVRVSDRDLGRAGQIRGRVPLEASRESRQFSDRTVEARNTSNRGNDRQVIRRDPRAGNGQRGAGATAAAATQPAARGAQTGQPPVASQDSVFRRTTPGSRATGNNGNNNAAAARNAEPQEQRNQAATPVQRGEQPRIQSQPNAGGQQPGNNAARESNGRGNAEAARRAEPSQQTSPIGGVSPRVQQSRIPRGGNVPAGPSEASAPGRRAEEPRVQPQENTAGQQNGNNAPRESNGRGNSEAARRAEPVQQTSPVGGVSPRVQQSRAVPRGGTIAAPQPQPETSAAPPRRAEATSRTNSNAPANREESPSRVDPSPSRDNAARRAPQNEPQQGRMNPGAGQNRAAPAPVEARPAPEVRRAPEVRPQPQSAPRAEPRGNGNSNPGGGANRSGPEIRSGGRNAAPAPAPEPARSPSAAPAPAPSAPAPSAAPSSDNGNSEQPSAFRGQRNQGANSNSGQGRGRGGR